jgi:O-antigen/teichoic acid export membrane protein
VRALSNAFASARALAGSVATGVLLQLVLAASGVLSARMLGPHDRGQLALLTLIPSLIAQLGGLGLPLAVTQFVAVDPGAKSRVIRAVVRPAIAQALVLTVVHVAVVGVVVIGGTHEVITAGLVTLATIPFQFLLGYSLAVLQGEQRFLPFNVLRSGPTVLYAFLLGAAWAVGATSLALVALLSVAPLGISGTVAFVLVRREPRDNASENTDAIPFRELLRFGLRSFLGSVSPIDSFRLDQLIVAAMFSSSQLGVYVVGSAFMNLNRFIAQSIGMVAAPRVASEVTPDARRRAIWNVTLIAAVFCCAATGLLLAVIPGLLPAIFGAQFSGAVSVAELLVATSFVMGLRRVLTDAARGAGRPTLGGVAEVTSLIALAPAVAIFASRNGLVGVALALLLSAATGVCTLLLALTPAGEAVWRRLRSVRAAQTNRRTCGVAALSAGAAVGLGLLIPTTLTGSDTTLLLTLAFALTAVVAVTVGLSKRMGEDALSPVALAGAYFILVFAAGATYFWFEPARTTRYPLLYDRRDLTTAVAMALFGWLGFAVGYLIRPLRSSRRSARTARPSGITPVAIPVASLLALGWFSRLVQVSSGRYFHTISSGAASSSNSGWLVSTGAALPTLALCYLGACVYLSGYGRRQKAAFWTVFASEAIWAIPTGGRANLASLGLILIVLRYYGRGIFPWRRLAILAAVIVFIVMPFGLAYRGSSGVEYQAAPVQSLRSAANRVASGSLGSLYKNGFEASMTRLSPVSSVAVVAHAGPDDGHLSATRSLGWALSTFIPRVFFAAKSDPALYGNNFGRSYGILRGDDYITSVAPTQIVEGYIVSGWPGIFVLLACVGFGYRLISDSLRRRTSSAFSLSLYAMTAWGLFQGEGEVAALGLVAVVKSLLAFAIILGLTVRLAAPRAERVSRSVPSLSVSG